MKITAPRDSDEYFRQTEHAVRHSYAGLDSCWLYYQEALQHWDISQVGQPMTPERKVALDRGRTTRHSNWARRLRSQVDSRSGQGVRVPNGRPGVYEVRRRDTEERLTIGKASDRRMRIKQGLVKGKTPHSSGEAIGSSEDTSKLEVRWAVVERRAAVEEELHFRHIAKFGGLPKYVQHT